MNGKLYLIQTFAGGLSVQDGAGMLSDFTQGKL